LRVLVTGTDGYIGCLLAQLLADEGHDVVGLDTGYYRDGWLYSSSLSGLQPATVMQDLRQVRIETLRSFDAVIHLAELSNDPLGENKPEITRQINHEGSIQLARLAREAGVKRFVYTSSCSVYGLGDGSFLDETAATNPQTEYARCKVRVENDVAELANDTFSPVFLRNATAFGPSPRMRFDIVLNNLTGLAWVYRKIAMTSDGTPWRPLVHVLDICHAISCCLTAPRDGIHNQVFNVGSNAENYRVRDIAATVADVFPGCDLTIGDSTGDNRSYRVSFDKIHERLPGFRCRWSMRDGALQLRDTYERIAMNEDRFEFRAFTRLRQLKYLIETGQIDDQFYWCVE
jgi:nucleoside-diphosphate-sugar epimerase